MTKEKHAKAAETAHGKKYGYLPQKGSEKMSGQRSCGRDKTPPMMGLRNVRYYGGRRDRNEDGEPNHVAKCPGHKQQRESPCFISFVSEFCHCTLNSANVSFYCTMQTAAG